MTGLGDLFAAHSLSERLRSDFKSVADVLGAKRAFYVFAGQVVQQHYPEATERKFVAIVRATYDDYLATREAAR